MELVIVQSYDALSRRAAELVVGAIKENPSLTLGLPTGNTPRGMYARLGEAYRLGQVDFSQVTTFNLDEYCDLPPTHPASYHAYMETHLFSLVNIPLEQRHLPDGMAPALEEACRAYEEAIAARGYLDLTVLGIGANGHVGFNEPGDALQSRVHVAQLSEETRQVNFKLLSAEGANPFPALRNFPTRAITMGMGTILKSRRLLLLASGEEKATAVYQMVRGPLTTRAPASFLQLHREVIVVLDQAAARRL